MMPVREATIRYEFPTCAADRQAFIARHACAGLQWVSTSIENGHERMKFAQFERFKWDARRYPERKDA